MSTVRNIVSSLLLHKSTLWLPFFLLLMLFCSLACIRLLSLQDGAISLLMCVNAAVCILALWKRAPYSASFFFLLTFCLLFIGGRFIAYFLYPSLSIWQGVPFYPEEIAPDRRAMVLTLILLVQYGLCIGFLLATQWPLHGGALQRIIPQYYSSSEVKSPMPSHLQGASFQWILFVIVLVLFALQLWLNMDMYCKVRTTNNYLMLYQSQSGTVPTMPRGIIQGCQMAFLGICWVYGDKKNKILSLLSVGVTALLLLAIGQRTLFGSFLLLCVWLYLRGKQLPLYKFILMLAAAFLALFFLSALSVRVFTYFEPAAFLHKVARFLHDNGMTISVLDLSIKYDNYLWADYLLQYCPGGSHFVKWFGWEFPNGVVGFSKRLCTTLDAAEYAEGFGMGWCIISTMYFLGGKCVVGLCALSLLAGAIAAWVRRAALHVRFFEVLQISVFCALMTSPRADLPILQIIYTCCFYLAFTGALWLCASFLKHRRIAADSHS